jgi:hypothetical protein
MVRLEGLGKLKIFTDLIGTRTRELAACSIVLQPSTLRRVPTTTCYHIDIRTLIYTRVVLDLLEIFGETYLEMQIAEFLLLKCSFQ